MISTLKLLFTLCTSQTSTFPLLLPLLHIDSRILHLLQEFAGTNTEQTNIFMYGISISSGPYWY